MARIMLKNTLIEPHSSIERVLQITLSLISPQWYTISKRHAVMHEAEKPLYYSRKIGFSMNRELIAKIWYPMSMIDSPVVHKLTDFLPDALSVISERID